MHIGIDDLHNPVERQVTVDRTARYGAPPAAAVSSSVPTNPDPTPPRPTPPTVPGAGNDQCEICGSDRLSWRNCKLVCANCRSIVKSCADL